MINRYRIVLVAVCVFCLTGSAAAAGDAANASNHDDAGLSGRAEVTVTYPGTTASGPTYNRPFCDGEVPATCSLSSTGTATRFAEDFLIIDTPGTYTISSTQDGWDGVLMLYEQNETFDPDSSLKHLLAFNDDEPSQGSSSFTLELESSGDRRAAIYRLVTAGYDNGASGTYTITVTGPDGALILITEGESLLDGLGESVASGPAWNRPDCTDAASDPTSLGSCTVATDRTPPFAAHAFASSCDGLFFFASEQEDYDGLLLLYEGAFDPDRPLDNLVAYNDDWPSSATTDASAFLVDLKANTDYIFVNTGFSTGSAGSFEQVVFGPQGCTAVTALEDAGEQPAAHALSPAYPNPFNPQTRFTLTIGQSEHIVIEVFDVLGRRVATLYNGILAAGTQHAFTFEAAALPSGLYTIRTVGETFVVTRTALLLK